MQCRYKASTAAAAASQGRIEQLERRCRPRGVLALGLRRSIRGLARCLRNMPRTCAAVPMGTPHYLVSATECLSGHGGSGWRPLSLVLGRSVSGFACHICRAGVQLHAWCCIVLKQNKILWGKTKWQPVRLKTHLPSPTPSQILRLESPRYLVQ